MTEYLMLAIKLAVVAMVVAIGMSHRLSEAAYLLKRPGLLVRSAIAMYVAVPLLALLIARFLPASPAIKAVLVVLSVSAGAPLLSKKLLFVGDTTYAFSLAIVSSLLAIVVAPAWIALLAQHFGVEAEVSPARVATALTKGFLAPLGVGIVVQVLAPEAGRRWAERVLGLGGLVMAAAGVGLAATHWDLILEVPPLGAVTLAVYLAGALLLGHVLGGPKDNDRTVLAITCATRHVAVALLVAASFRGPRTAVLVVCYMLVMLAVSIPYVKWRKRVSSQTPTPAAPAGT